MNLETRIANNDDIPSLVYICRKGFPDKAIWQAPKSYAKGMWEAILSWDNNETWICSVNGQVSGFVTLVTNPASFEQKWFKQRKTFRSAIVYSCILSPRFLFNKAWKKMLAYRRRFKNDKSISHTSGFSKKNHLWISIIAVAPEMRRRGVAKKLIEQSRRRAVDLGKEAASLKVDIRNRPARKLYEKMDFTYIHSDCEYCYYSMNLNGKR